MYQSFEYIRPDSVGDLLKLLADEKLNSHIYGGGTDLLVFMRAGKIKADRIIDIKGIEQFSGITENDDEISIGSAVTLHEINNDPVVIRWAPALAQAAGQVGSVQIRHKGTIAGNIQTASPAGDALNVAYGLDGRVELVSAEGTRIIPLAQHILGPRKTSIGSGEVISRVLIPKRKWTQESFFKVGRRNALAISIVNGVVAVMLDEKGMITDARISVGAVAPTPLRIVQAEEFLIGTRLCEADLDKTAEIVSSNVSPISDIRAGADYRRYMAGAMVRRQLEDMIGKEVR